MTNNAISPVREIDFDTDLERPEPPKRYHVILLNDDFTSMEFVIALLMDVFHKDIEEAKLIMLKVHYEQRGVAGTYTREIAEDKASHVKALARANDFPLNCVVEVAE